MLPGKPCNRPSRKQPPAAPIREPAQTPIRLWKLWQFPETAKSMAIFQLSLVLLWRASIGGLNG